MSVLSKVWHAYADWTDRIGFLPCEDKEPELLNDFFGFHVIGVVVFVVFVWVLM